jgi:hypothetical protein
MKANNSKSIERIVNKAMKSSQIEQPSFNFTEQVMSQVEAYETGKISYKPLISKKHWMIIATSIIVLTVILMFRETEHQPTYLSPLYNLLNSDFSYIRIPSNLNISNVFMYGILLFGLLFGIQVPLVKYYYFKRNNE